MIGVVGYAPDNTYVVRDASEVALLPQLRSPLVVSQTTIKLKTFSSSRSSGARSLMPSRSGKYNLLGNARSPGRGARTRGQVDVFYSSAAAILKTASSCWQFVRTV